MKTKTLTLHKADIHTDWNGYEHQGDEIPCVLLKLDGEPLTIMLDDGYEMHYRMTVKSNDMTLTNTPEPFATFTTADSEELVHKLFINHKLTFSWVN